MASSKDRLKSQQLSGTIVKPKKMVSSFSKLMEQAAAMDTSVLGARLKVRNDGPVASGTVQSTPKHASTKTYLVDSRPVKRKSEQVMKPLKTTTVSAPLVPSKIVKAVSRPSIPRSQTQPNPPPILNTKPTCRPGTKNGSPLTHPPSGDKSLQGRSQLMPKEGDHLPLKAFEASKSTNGNSSYNLAPGALARSFRPPSPSKRPTQPPSRITKSIQSKSRPLKLPKREVVKYDEDDESIDSFIADSDEDGDIDYRSEIRQIFGQRKTSTIYDDDDDADDDTMEASGLELEREERRAAKLARLEDEREARLEEQRIQSKMKRKIVSK